MLAFLRRPKWIILGVIVVIIVPSCIGLGFWQLARLQQVRDENVRIIATRSAQVDPAARLLRTDRAPGEDLKYRKVTASGVWDTANQILVRGRSITNKNGLFVLTPLITDGGTRLLVARGWIAPSKASAATPPNVPTPTAGRVTVTGRVKLPETGEAKPSTIGAYRTVSRIDPTTLGRQLGKPTYQAFIELTTQSPALAAGSPALIPQGTLEEGNHESYAYQWFSFAVLAVIGYLLMIALEVRKLRRQGKDLPLSRFDTDEDEPADRPTASTSS